MVDATVGGGGHSRELLAALGPQTHLIGIDKDEAALVAAGEFLAEYGPKVALRRGDFRDLADIVEQEGVETVDVVVADLGVSSPQLDWPERGFSFRFDAPLDMRMDPSTGVTAADIVNGYDEHRLAGIISEYGEERFARRIASAIVAARGRGPIVTTTELAEIVKSAIPAATRRTGRHPARRTFQALRVAVNDELGALAALLDSAPGLLAPGGVMAVIAYHSLEDRMVKRKFRALTSPVPTPRGLPVAPAAPPFTAATSGAVRPSQTELEANPRAQSARLRAVRRRGDEAA